MKLRAGTRVILLVSTLLLVVIEGSARADVVMNLMQDGTVFYSRKRTAKAILADNGTEYRVSVQNHALYTIKVGSAKLDPKRPLDLWLANGRAYLSDDGVTVVWLLSPAFTGHLKLECVEAKTGGVEYICPPEKFNRMVNQPALAVFKNGKLIKTYSLNFLLKRPILVGETAEQTIWIRPGVWSDDQTRFPNVKNPALSKDGRRFTFETSSFRRYTIDSKNGNILGARDTDFWKNSKMIVWGKFTKSRKRDDTLVIEPSIVLKGKQTLGKLTAYDCTRSYFGFDYHLSFWTGAALERHGKRYEIVRPIWNFPMHVEPW